MNLACFRGSTGHVERKISSPDSGKQLNLNPDDLKTIQKMWNGFPDKANVGLRIFLRVFSAKPELSPVFGIDGLEERFAVPADYAATDIDLSELEKFLSANKRFTAHTKAFASFLDMVVQELCSEPDHPEDLISIIRSMGQHHSTIPNISFTAENWLLIKTAILETVCGAELYSRNPLDKLCISWSKLLMFIIGEMKDAYLMGVNRKNTWPRSRMMSPVAYRGGGGESEASPSEKSLVDDVDYDSVVRHHRSSDTDEDDERESGFGSSGPISVVSSSDEKLHSNSSCASTPTPARRRHQNQNNANNNNNNNNNNCNNSAFCEQEEDSFCEQFDIML